MGSDINQFLSVLNSARNSSDLVVQTLKLVVLMARLDTLLFIKLLQPVDFPPELCALDFDCFDFVFQVG